MIQTHAFRSLRLALEVLTLTLLFVLPASAQIAGFGNGANYTVNSNSVASSIGLPSVNSGTVKFTDSSYFNTAGSLFYDTPQTITSFRASFTYTVPSPFGPADGIAFVLQNDPRGTSALGDLGGALAYGTGGSNAAITPSAAIELNVFNGHTVGTNFATDGTWGNYNSTGSVNLLLGDPIGAVLSYDGTTLTETLTDLAIPADTYTASYTTDLTSVLGASTAYVGFTGADGGNTSTQLVSNFSYGPVPEASTFTDFACFTLGCAALILFSKRRQAQVSKTQ